MNTFILKQLNNFFASIAVLAFFAFLAVFNPRIYAHNSNSAAVSAHPLATQIGLNVLKQGGNAIDAAVAMGYALAVVEPCCGNLGGGGFMLIHFANGKNTFFNFREKAPYNISQKLYFSDNKIDINKIRRGYLAAGIPGTVMGLNAALKKYGTMPLSQLIKPAVDLAANGFQLTSRDLYFLTPATEKFRQEKNVATIFLNNNQPYKIGDTLIQKDLANSLSLIAAQGDKAFYQGPITKKLITASQQHGGVFTAKDFENYSVEELQPIYCHYRGYTVITSPPPSSGGITLCLMLNILEPYPLEQFGFHSLKSIHYTVEAMRYAYADRNQYLADPDFVSMPLQKLLSTDYAASIRKNIKINKAGNSRTIGLQIHHEKPQTISYAVIDKWGNAVSVTYTLNGLFGSGVIADQSGFFLNNEMDDFTLQVGIPNSYGLIQGETNAIAPGKRPLSAMTPTIMTKNNKLFLVTGAAGGSTITTQVLSTIQNVIDYHMPLHQAINSPRIHMQWLPDVIYMEPSAISTETQKQLRQMGYHLKLGSPFTTLHWGESVGILVKDDKLITALDYRHQVGVNGH